MNWFRARCDRNSVARSLKRRRASLNPKLGFFLFCEGRNTEPDYFRAIRNSGSGDAINIQVIGEVRIPMTLARTAVETVCELERKKNPLSDQVWTVFDRDNYPQFDDAVALCRQHDIGVPRSDPCFELRLILHLQDFDGPCTCRNIQREIEALQPTYDRNRPTAEPRGTRTVGLMLASQSHASSEQRRMLAASCHLCAGSSFSSPLRCRLFWTGMVPSYPCQRPARSNRTS